MQKLSGFQYLLIDIANCFGNGLDKALWDERIEWVINNKELLEDLVIDAEDPFLYMKAVRALRDTEAGVATGHIMGLDATASGLQMMACMTGCRSSAKKVNLINTGNREDAYTDAAEEMDKLCTSIIDRELIKTPMMATFYGSKKEPKNIFGESSDELKAYYKMLEKEFKGPMEMMDDLRSCWDSNALAHTWPLPDGHTAHVPTKEEVSIKIEVDELDHATFHFISEILGPSTNSTPIIANVVHSVDAYVLREMVRMAHAQRFEMVTIHDNYFASPNHMQKVRENYVKILADIADSDLLGDIIGELIGEPVTYTKLSKNLSKDILKSEYALS